MKKDIQVHCLPTKKASHLSQNATGKWYWDDVTYGTSPNFQPYYLYATIDEQPKDGDWAINTWHNQLFQKGVFAGAKHGNRKVVATTDEELHKQVWSSNGIVLMAETQYPPISPEFQQAWVKAANEGNPIVDAVMEFEEVKQVIKEEKRYTPIGTPYTDIEWGLQAQPKINDKGYVTILPKVEKMYPLIALKECFHAARRLLPSNNEDNDFSEWLQIYEEVNS